MVAVFGVFQLKCPARPGGRRGAIALARSRSRPRAAVVILRFRLSRPGMRVLHLRRFKYYVSFPGRLNFCRRLGTVVGQRLETADAPTGPAEGPGSIPTGARRPPDPRCALNQ